MLAMYFVPSRAVPSLARSFASYVLPFGFVLTASTRSAFAGEETAMPPAAAMASAMESLMGSSEYDGTVFPPRPQL